ncbi:hypothetical protein BMW24_023000 [Mycobacterium heckeshornense]|uniref:Uncharacterized protein n=1 Tax=Mycobacterium heckeshornense TaxID=110505 RepID=A0A2G8AVC5_9MYCO|nr:hypothetical protein [Mycobacterium heckeshornense]KMV23266.1 hypothetical protein ACT16_06140 [Mycobacterium heckeshornense]MCV7032855.1 hypothetical protein [Mycobacterium heckeshornense]PIJ29471.1 hypothetical protein BMW24_023000 [Mycobacterium heckeshornense]BCO35497.1 hypothetical protein MHEC_19300 [Mycobacterium heckeshornense]
MKLDELYDPIADAPFARFPTPGDSYHGTLVAFDMRPDRFSNQEIPTATLRLSEPTEDGDEYVHVSLRSAALRREFGRAAHRAGRVDIDDGLGRDHIRITYIEDRESAGGNTFKVYRVEYTAVGSAAPIGAAELGEAAADPGF